MTTDARLRDQEDDDAVRKALAGSRSGLTVGAIMRLADMPEAVARRCLERLRFAGVVHDHRDAASCQTVYALVSGMTPVSPSTATPQNHGNGEQLSLLPQESRRR